MYLYIVMMIIGSCFGSFLYCLCNEKIHLRSRCDHCGRILAISDLIPIVSYLLNNGRCRYCKQKISSVYLISEVIMAVLYVLVYIRYGFSLKFLEILIMINIMFCISVIDIKSYIIPDITIALLFINKVIFWDSKLIINIIESFLICVLIWTMAYLLKMIKKCDVMGFGDIKLYFVLNLYLTYPQNYLAIAFSGIIALLYMCFTSRNKEIIPFGPFICMAFTMFILF